MDKMRTKVQGFICGPKLYKYEDWFFEYHSYCGPWPLCKDGELFKRAGKRFYDMISRFSVEPDWGKYRVGGGCMVL